MEDTEKIAEALPLDETMEGSELPTDETDNIQDIGSVYTANDAIVESTEAAQDRDLPEHLMGSEEEAPTDTSHDENLAEGIMDVNQDGTLVAFQDDNQVDNFMEANQEDIEMADNVGEDTKSDNETTDEPAMSSLEPMETMETSDGTVSTSDELISDQFTTENAASIVEDEPPQQFMEADTPGEEKSSEDIGTSEIDESSNAAVATDESLFDYVEDKSTEVLQEQEDEGILMQQEGEHDEQGVLETLAGLSESGGANLPVVSDQLADETDDHLDNLTENTAEELLAEGPAVVGASGIMELPLEESDAENSAAEGTGGFTILAGDHLGASLGDLDGKIVVGSDGTVHLLTGQESLQGIQLMEGDDKPEELANGEENAAQLQEDIRAQLHEALLKQEEIKHEKQDKGAEPEPSLADQSNPEADALSTLATAATAALDHQSPTNGVKTEPDIPEVKSERDEPQWMDVGICKGTHCIVRTFYVPNEGQSWDKNWEGINTTTLPDHRALAKLELEAGKAYKFRVAAINSCGRGPWSEISAFRTSMPGVPGAPSAIKISKTTEGAHLSWEPPSAASGPIADYTVYMAVRSATTDSQVVSSGANQLAFVRIYQGEENQCSVGFENLTEAHIDTTTKPAILFRIAARNEKGLGPAIQVRWLQDQSIPNSAKPTVAARRVGAEMKPHSNIKRKKSECE